MTPAEMCVLFSSNVLAFLLIWFTNVSERREDAVGCCGPLAAPQAKSHHAATTTPATRENLREDNNHHNQYAWNVGSFFGLKSA